MYINHLTLSTGHNKRIERGEVDGETLARIGPWLAALADPGGSGPLPLSDLSAFSALVSVFQGSLLMTVSGPPMKVGPQTGTAPPLVTVGVAKRSRHGATLWPLITAMPGIKVKAGLERPAEPWCAIAIHPTIMLYPKSVEWLGDFERCVAWAWCTRPADED